MNNKYLVNMHLSSLETARNRVSMAVALSWSLETEGLID